MYIGQGARQYGQGAAPSEIGLAGTLCIYLLRIRVGSGMDDRNFRCCVIAVVWLSEFTVFDARPRRRGCCLRQVGTKLSQSPSFHPSFGSCSDRRLVGDC